MNQQQAQRSPWQGVASIVRFNAPMYGMAFLILLVAGITGLLVAHQVGKMLSWLIGMGMLWLIVGSLVTSWWVYDRSELYRFGWLSRALQGLQAKRWVFAHSGFDETSAVLRERLGGEWTILDHFDAERMTEPSIHRARALFPPTADTVVAAFDRWPVEDGSTDGVFALLAVHELRSVQERGAWFAEAKRAMRSGGRVVVVEHVRDVANFCAFGPGFLHFHSVSAWRRSWQIAGMRELDHFRITPFIRVFVLESP